MNDLERDLHELFEQRATKADAPVLAPEAVLRHGRRRQARTVAGSAIASLLAIAVAVAAFGVVRRPVARPLSPSLPERVTTIGGVPVTAPAGWTLVNDWPLAGLLPITTQECSFTGTGTAVDQNGSPVDASPAEAPSSTQESCSSSPVAYPAGMPVLQLANFEIPLLETVCGLGDGSPTALPDDGVAVYVGEFPAGLSTGTFIEACPGADQYGLAAGESVVTFADLSGPNQANFGAIGVAGPDASSDDIQIAATMLQRLGDLSSDVHLTVPSSVPGPGYVLATGDAGGTSWRLEAGITSLSQNNGAPSVAAVLVTTDQDGEASRTVSVPTTPSVLDDYSDLGSAGVVQFGTATFGVTGIDIVDANGIATAATLVRWPAGIQTLDGVDRGVDGWIWFALADERGEVRARTTSEPTSSVAPSPDGTQLDYTRSGDTVTATGTDIGHDWKIRTDGTRVWLYIDGALWEDTVHSTLRGAQMHIDLDGGTFLIGLQPSSVDTVTVDVDATDTTPAHQIAGRYGPVQDVFGKDGRLWLVVLPGTGAGMETIGEELPWFLSWPTLPMTNGSIVASGTDPTVSWGLRYRDAQCMVLETIGADPGDTATSDCLRPPENPTSAMIQGAFGTNRSTMAILVTHRPETTVDSPDLTNGEIQCVDIDDESSFAGSTICVFPVDTGETVTINLDQGGDPLNGPFRITATGGAATIIVPPGGGSPSA